MIIPLAKGLALTFKTLFRPRRTLLYPEQKKVMYERWRGRPSLIVDAEGKNSCVACGICVKGCPAQAITVTMGKREDNTRYPEKIEVDIGRCIFCGFCAQSCPKSAMKMSHAYELATDDKKKLIVGKEELAKHPE